MSKLNEILALSDTGARVESAVSALRNNLVFAVRDGNKRNLEDTAEAMREAGAQTKAGAIAATKKGALLGALIAAMNAGEGARVVFAPEFVDHKGKPTAVMTERASALVAPIVEAYEATIRALVIKAKPTPKPKPVKVEAGTEAGAEAGTEAGAEALDSKPVAFLRRALTIYQKRLAHRDATIAMLRRARELNSQRLDNRDDTIAALQAEIARLKESTIAPTVRKSRKAA